MTYEQARREGPHFMRPEPEEGRAGYWREFLFCSDGEVVTGTGGTKEIAEQAARDRWQEREDYLKLALRDRLRILNGKPSLCPKEINEAVRILMELALQ